MWALILAACSSACDEGLMWCYGPNAGDCCNYFMNDICFDACPNPFVPNATNTSCVCPSDEGSDCGVIEGILKIL